MARKRISKLLDPPVTGSTIKPVKTISYDPTKSETRCKNEGGANLRCEIGIPT